MSLLPPNIHLPYAIAQHVVGAEWQQVDSYSSTAYVYRLSFPDSTHYLKICTHEAQDTLLAEQRALAWLAHADEITVPRVIAFAQTATHQFLLSQGLSGIHPMHDDLAIAPQERVQLLAQLARRFHKIPLHTAHNLHRRKHADFLAEVEAINAPQPIATMQQLLPSLEQPDYTVTHGDFYPVNMLVDPHTKHVTGFIDCARLGIADSYLDLAPLADAIAWHLGTEWIPTLFENYRHETKIDADKLAFYRAYFATRRAR